MENMRQMLRGSLGRSLENFPAFERLSAAWPVACGTAMARKATLLGLSEGYLDVEVEDVAWMEQLRGMQTVLEHELARIADVKLAGIHFQLKGLRRRER
jgi:predicted nucleic acid-binding Zn ribbon protein